MCTLSLMRALAFVALTAAAAHAKVIYVRAAAASSGTGTDWSHAFASLSAAINSAAAGDEIWVAEGIYDPIALKDGVTLIGGFAGDETDVSASDPLLHGTYIDGGGVSRCLESIGNAANTVVRGFHITNGSIDLPTELLAFPETGAAVYLDESHASFVLCVFEGNHSESFGGAVGIRGGAPMFLNCRFSNNEAAWAGGAVYARDKAAPSFQNCLFNGNLALEAGAVSLVDGPATFTNCTFADNTATIGRGAAIFDSPGSAILRNSILWRNDSPLGIEETISNSPGGGALTTVTFSDVEGGWAGEGNSHADPKFLAPGTGDYRLQAISPCRDSGAASPSTGMSEQDVPEQIGESATVDLAVAPRVTGSAVDMGAYEWSNDQE